MKQILITDLLKKTTPIDQRDDRINIAGNPAFWANIDSLISEAEKNHHEKLNVWKLTLKSLKVLECD